MYKDSNVRILILQNFQLTPFGVIGEVIQERGGNITILMPAQGDILTSNTTDFDGLIILGGPMNAEDDESFPWLQNLITLINQFHEERKPILGSCLGAQVIARVLNVNLGMSDKIKYQSERENCNIPFRQYLRRKPEIFILL